jgi:4-hydroxy-tetrahydrodipicolinate synthase
MVAAKDARAWARESLRGIGDSLYTPFSGADGEDIDWDAYRSLVRYCVGDLGHPMLWLTSGIAEWWSLTIPERERLLEITVDEVRTTAPGAVIQSCTSAISPKDALQLTRHAQEADADICYLQTPPMEVHGGEGTLRFFQYVADRTDIALGMFNSPSSGYVLTPEECARIYEEVPAVCAIKEGCLQPWRSKALHRLAPGLVIWECDTLVYRAGWLQEGITVAAQLGSNLYLSDTPSNPVATTYWNLIWAGDTADAIRYAKESGLERLEEALRPWSTKYPGRPDYFTHWGACYRHAAKLLGLPVGSYPESRPPQAFLPQQARDDIRTVYESLGMVKEPVGVG